jgi:hypothetical protein
MTRMQALERVESLPRCGRPMLHRPRLGAAVEQPRSLRPSHCLAAARGPAQGAAAVRPDCRPHVPASAARLTPRVCRRPAGHWIHSPPRIHFHKVHDRLCKEAPPEEKRMLADSGASAHSDGDERALDRRRVRSKYGETVIGGAIASRAEAQARHWCRQNRMNLTARY